MLILGRFVVLITVSRIWSFVYYYFFVLLRHVTTRVGSKWWGKPEYPWENTATGTLNTLAGFELQLQTLKGMCIHIYGTSHTFLIKTLMIITHEIHYNWYDF